MEACETVAVQSSGINEKQSYAAAEDVGEQSEDELDRLITESIDREAGQLEEWQVLTHIFKAFIGTGILGLPSAVMHGGVVFGPLILLLLGLTCMYNVKLLVDTAKNIRQTLAIERISYSSISEHLFSVYGVRSGLFAKYFTDLLLSSLQLGFCCVYVVFIAHNIQAVVGILDVRLWMIMIFPMILIPSLISNIRRLAYFTTMGNVIVLIGLGIIYHYLIKNMKNPLHLPASTTLVNVFVSLGQIVYAFEGIAVILPIENKLKKRESFDWLIKIAACVVVFFYATIGILGYFTFGTETLGSITLNLPQTPLYQIVQSAFALMVFFTYPLQLLVSVEIIESYFHSAKSSKMEIFVKDVLLRSTLVIITCILAICIPQLDNFMALVGSVCGVAVGLILPPILHSLCYWNQGLSNIQLAVDILIVIVGVFAFVTGTVSTIYSIMHRYIHHPGSTKSLLS